MRNKNIEFLVTVRLEVVDHGQLELGPVNVNVNAAVGGDDAVPHDIDDFYRNGGLVLEGLLNEFLVFQCFNVAGGKHNFLAGV